MIIKDAIKIVRQVCATYRGTLDEHNNIQLAIQTIEAELAELKAKQENDK